MNRIVIVGATGSGKTTLAGRIADRLKIYHIEIDSVYWGENWEPISLETFRHQIDTETRGNRWVMDGNYSKVRDLVWGRADVLVWLDFPLFLVFWQLLKRSLKRIRSKETLWHGNRETFRGMFLSRDSLFLWLFKSYPEQKKTYPLLISQPLYNHLELVRLKSPGEVEKWLNSI